MFIYLLSETKRKPPRCRLVCPRVMKALHFVLQNQILLGSLEKPIHHKNLKANMIYSVTDFCEF